MATLQKKLWLAIESILAIHIALIIFQFHTRMFFNTKLLNVLIDETIDVLVGINRGLIYTSVAHGVLEMGIFGFKAFVGLLKTIGFNAIYNALKLTTFFLSLVDIIICIVCYHRLTFVMKECSYYFNYYQYHQNQLVPIISYFMNKEKFIYCENRHSELYYCIVFTAFVVCLYIPLGVLKIVKLFN